MTDHEQKKSCKSLHCFSPKTCKVYKSVYFQMYLEPILYEQKIYYIYIYIFFLKGVVRIFIPRYILFYYYLTLQNQSWDSTEVRPLSLKIHIILKVTGSPSYRYSNMLFNLYFSLWHQKITIYFTEVQDRTYGFKRGELGKTLGLEQDYLRR